MLRVRFPNGMTVEYNSANHLEYGPISWHLYEKQSGRFVAAIQPSAGVIVESVPACNVYHSTADRKRTRVR